MSSIEQTNREKALLKAAFDYCNITDIIVEARRMDGHLHITAQQAWDAEVSVKHPSEPIPVARFFDLQKSLDGPLQNHLYLMPSRKLSETEWKAARPILQAIFNSSSIYLPFDSGIKVMTQDNILHEIRKPLRPA